MIVGSDVDASLYSNSLTIPRIISSSCVIGVTFRVVFGVYR